MQAGCWSQLGMKVLSDSLGVKWGHKKPIKSRRTLMK